MGPKVFREQPIALYMHAKSRIIATGHIRSQQLQDKVNRKSKIRTSTDLSPQKHATRILRNHHNNLAKNGINNLAALITDVETGETLAYIGNIYGSFKVCWAISDCGAGSCSEKFEMALPCLS